MTEIERLRFQLSLLALASGGKAPDVEWRALVEFAGQVVRDAPPRSVTCDTEPGT
jgi:hypothetical protein